MALENALDHIPIFLKEFLLWCVWISEFTDSDGNTRTGKFPCSPITGKLISVADPSQWVGYAEAVRNLPLNPKYTGLGVLLRHEDNVIGLDLDDAIDPQGGLKDWAVRITDAVDAYWELSPSGRGLRGFLRGTLPPGFPKRIIQGDGGVEIYTHGRFLTVTGHWIPGSKADVEQSPASVEWLTNFLRGSAGPPEPSDDSETRDARIDRIIQGCGWIRQCRDNAATLSEPDWYRMLGIVGRCEGGERLAHEWSRPYPRYSAGDTAAKLVRALTESGPATCQYIAVHLGHHEICSRCPNWGHISSPIVLGIVAEWPDPQKLEGELLPVPAFSLELLPSAFRRYAADVAARMNVPIEFIAIALMVCLAGLTGRRARVRVKQFDDWIEVAKLWGGVVSDPGTMKTPALKKILKLVERLEYEAEDRYRREMEQYQLDLARYEVGRHEARRRLVNTAAGPELQEYPDRPPEKPTRIRHLVNDATVAKLQEILSENPAGLLLFRDELAGWFAKLDAKGNESDRAFYLESWDGELRYAIDRITRGTVRAVLCLSILGGIQPGVLRPYLLAAIVGGAGDDGLPQRLQLVVYPDPLPSFENVDREPDREAENAVVDVFRRIVAIPLDLDPPFIARFSPDAQLAFNDWRTLLENRLNREPMPGYLRSHLSKYRGLMPVLAMLCHLADSPDFSREIPLDHAQRAANWCQFLEEHAKRVYAVGSPRSMAGVVGERLKSGALGTRFTVRDLRKKGWSGLTDSKVLRAILDELIDTGWIRREPVPTTDLGGRPTEVFLVNPKVYRPSDQPEGGPQPG